MISTINAGLLERGNAKVNCAFNCELYCGQSCAAFDIKDHQGKKLVTCGRLAPETWVIGLIDMSTGVKKVENDVIPDVPK